jgi:hypothetical protein
MADKRARRPKGTGGIRNRGTARNPRWFGFHHVDFEGKRHQVTQGPFRTKAEAEDWVQSEVRRTQEGRPTLPSQITVAEPLDEWLAVRKAGLEPARTTSTSSSFGTGSHRCSATAKSRNRPLAVAPVSLAAGIVSLTAAVRLATAAQPRSEVAGMVEYGAIFLLVGLSLFWAAADYSAAVGRSRAAQFVRELPSHPEAIVYSEHSLNMRAHGVGVVHCRDPEAAYGYRYDGLALVLQSNDQYVLLPKDWSPGDGVAMMLPRNDSVRLEFMRAGAADLGPIC